MASERGERRNHVQEPEQTLLDEAALGELATSVGGDVAFVSELIDAYLGDAPLQVAQIQQAAEAGDVASVVRPAHTLKSSSATVGAQRLAATARRLELASRSEDLGDVGDDLAGLEAEWRATEQALRAWIARAAG